jgi:hypothetical protein
MSPPIVLIFVTPDSHEWWPAALFVPAHVAAAAVEYTLRYRQPDLTRHWIGAGNVPRGEPCGMGHAPNGWCPQSGSPAEARLTHRVQLTIQPPAPAVPVRVSRMQRS